MSKMDVPKLVTALFTFKGKNNDELCFKKGDIITITQTDDGGWWEGTLNDKTGWFPSNYVKEYRTPDSGASSVKSSPEKVNQELPVHQRLNRDIVLKDLVDSERAHVAELQGLINNFLQPLELTNILKKEEYKQLTGNFNEVFETHQRLLTSLEATITQGLDARVGNLFLTIAPRLKAIHTTYCSGHPQAVCILDQFRDELNDFMERNGAVAPGILVLTTGLSKPFRRLEKYGAMLQELERHTEKNHSDRGDTQRSVCVYREISERCTCTRKQKELALHVLMGGIKGWEGEELNSLGEILHVGPVTMLMGVERHDRYFVLFPMTLLVLSRSPRMSSFVYEGKLPLTSIEVAITDDTDDIKNALEISGPMIESIIVLCANKDERQQWVEYLTQQHATGLVRSPTMSHTSNQSCGKIPQMPQERCSSPGTKVPWSLACLRPAPPIYMTKTNSKSDCTDFNRSPRFTNERQFEDDAIILKVIESYCMAVSARFTAHSELAKRIKIKSVLDSESSNKPRDRVSIVNNRIGQLDSCEDSIGYKIDTSLSKSVEILRNQVADLQTQMTQLTKQLDEEKQSRLLLTAAVKRITTIDSFGS